MKYVFYLLLDQVASSVVSQERKAKHIKKIVDKQSNEISIMYDITYTLSGLSKVFDLYLKILLNYHFKKLVSTY